MGPPSEYHVWTFRSIAEVRICKMIWTRQNRGNHIKWCALDLWCLFRDFSLANPRKHLFQLTTCDFLPAPHFFPPVQVELFDNHEVLNAHYMGCTFKHRSILEPARISNFLRQSDNLLSVLNFYQYWTIFFFKLYERDGGAGDVRSFPKNYPSLGPEASLNMKTAQTSVNQAFIQSRYQNELYWLHLFSFLHCAFSNVSSNCLS